MERIFTDESEPENNELAAQFCVAAHESIDQKRKFTGAAYWHHPHAVVGILRPFSPSEEAIQAAYLHDVIEDVTHWNPHYDIVLIRSTFGHRVAELVLEVTEISKPEDGNREIRKKLDREHYARASFDGQNIKLADLIDNTRDIAKHDPKFAKVYLREKEELLGILTNCHKELYELAQKELAQAWVSLVGR